MLTLYTTSLSANGRKPLAVGKQLGLPLEVRQVNVYRGEGQDPKYRELNPWGKVPTLVDEELVLWESNAILVYLCERGGDSALWPSSPAQRAEVLRWMFWESSHFQPVLNRVLAPRVGQLLFAPADAPPVAVAWDDAELTALLAGLDAALRERAYLCGAQPTIADFSVAGMTTYFAACGFPRERFAAIARWLDRMAALPSWSASLAELWKRPVS